MSTALLVEYFNQLPENRDGQAPGGKARQRAALDSFKRQAGERYNEAGMAAVDL